MLHCVIGRLVEIAVAESRTGDVTVELFAGVETFTVTRAETLPQAAKKRHKSTMGGFHRITRLLL
jgi:hypothetical protein